MNLTPEQVKGRIRNIAKEKNADARMLMRIHMMERFLERIANDMQLHQLWKSYQKKYTYASDVSFDGIIKETMHLYNLI